MSIQKIFMTLVVVVACLFIGALVLNTILPNALSQGINAIEGTIYNGTGIRLDLNGDGKTGSDSNNSASDALEDGSKISNTGGESALDTGAESFMDS